LKKVYSSSILKKVKLILLAFIWNLTLFGQVQNIPLNYGINQEINLHQLNRSSYNHNGMKPYCMQYIDTVAYNYTFKDTSKHYYDFTIFLYKRSLLEIKKDDVNISADLLLDVEFGKTNSPTRGNARMLTNTRGVRVAGDIGKTLSFETRFYENQFYFTKYLDSIALKRGIAFGRGRTKPFKAHGFDVGNSSGYVSIKASKQLNIQFGHDKLFYGHGYRSLLLSDNASNYPMLRFQYLSKNGKWAYQNVNALLQSLSRLPATSSAEALFKRKAASFRYLSFKPSKKLELGLFEGVVYNNYNDTLGMVPVHYSYYIPVIGAATAINGLQGENNSLLGLNANYTFCQFNIFGQIALDNLDKIGFQLGGNWFEPFGLKKNWFHAEFNSVPSYMYTHDSQNILQNYSHTNQELAHPIGASFNEALAIYHFEKGKWFAEAEFALSRRTRINCGPNGENILQANDPVLCLLYSEDKITTAYWKVEAGHSFNLKTRMQAFFGVYSRNLYNRSNNLKNQSDLYYTVGLRMNLNNYYYDI
jgi:hypothetical protein